jgi:hypothetical protein
MDSLERHTWLRGAAGGPNHLRLCEVLVCGPDAAERFHVTKDGEARFALLHGYDAELKREGWSLQSYITRRTARQGMASIPSKEIGAVGRPTDLSATLCPTDGPAARPRSRLLTFAPPQNV